MNERQINYRTAHYRVRKKHEPNQRAGYSRKLQSAQPTSSVDEDDKAFKAFKTCLNAKRPSRYARTLEKLLNRTLDPESNSISFLLKDILTLTDKVFFNRKLRTNIEWRWSRPNEEGYATDFLGTTTPIYLNDMQNPGHERTQAEIVLSSPFLRSKEYKSTLLISTFIHELVHCYLFVTCGRKAEKNDGHTEAFEKIVHEIEKWLQNDDLRLCNMKADLDFFKAEQDHVVDERDDEADGFVVVPSASPQRQIVCTEEEIVYSCVWIGRVWRLATPVRCRRRLNHSCTTRDPNLCPRRG